MYFWSLIMAFSLYSRIPLPGLERLDWESARKEYILCFFPLVGLVIGAAEVVLLALSDVLGFPPAAAALFFIALPVLMTGGIHLDGFVDASDALQSFLPREEKLRIMKDPHVGAFGVIRLAVYFLLCAGAAIWFFDRMRGSLLQFSPGIALVFALSRAVTGLSAQLLPTARKEGMLDSVLGEAPARKRAARILSVELIAVAALFLMWRPAFAVPLFIVFFLIFLYYRYMTAKQFGGVSGDLSGWLLCVLELAAVFVFAGVPAVLEFFAVLAG